MWMPEGLEQRRFKDWNLLVRELMEVWETAHLLGKEAWFQEQLEACSEEKELRERLGDLRAKLAAEAAGSGYNLAESVDRIADPDGPDATPPADADKPETG
jgi:hypothetical protein